MLLFHPAVLLLSLDRILTLKRTYFGADTPLTCMHAVHASSPLLPQVPTLLGCAGGRRASLINKLDFLGENVKAFAVVGALLGCICAWHCSITRLTPHSPNRDDAFLVAR